MHMHVPIHTHTYMHICTYIYTHAQIDYAKLIDQFGSQPISSDLIARFERVTGAAAHPWLKRGIFFS